MNPNYNNLNARNQGGVPPPQPPHSMNQSAAPMYQQQQMGQQQAAYGQYNPQQQQQQQSQPQYQFQQPPQQHFQQQPPQGAMQQNYPQAQQQQALGGQGVNQMQYQQNQTGIPQVSNPNVSGNQSGFVGGGQVPTQPNNQLQQQQQQPSHQEQPQEQTPTEVVQEKFKGLLKQAKDTLPSPAKKHSGPNIGFKPTAAMAQQHEDYLVSGKRPLYQFQVRTRKHLSAELHHNIRISKRTSVPNAALSNPIR